MGILRKNFQQPPFPQIKHEETLEQFEAGCALRVTTVTKNSRLSSTPDKMDSTIFSKSIVEEETCPFLDINILPSLSYIMTLCLKINYRHYAYNQLKIMRHNRENNTLSKNKEINRIGLTDYSDAGLYGRGWQMGNKDI